MPRGVTKKQREVVKNMMNGDEVSTAMRKAGYSEVTIDKPKNVTESEGFKELISKVIPDKLLIKKHREGLNATTKKPHLVDRDDKGRPIYEYVGEADYSVRHKYLDTAYKIKGKYPQVGIGVAVQINISKVLDELENEQ